MELLEQVISWINKAKRIVAFTGAGASTDSGIPDLMEIDKILHSDNKFKGGVFDFLDSNFAEKNPREFYRLYHKTFFHPEAKPNNTHKFIAKLEKKGKLLGIATMNIDYLHQMSGSKTVYEYWGDMRKNHCIGCNRSYDWNLVKQTLVPICSKCGQVIIPDFVLRNLAAYPNEINKGRQLIAKADLLIIVGTKRNSSSFLKNIPKIVVNKELKSESKDNLINVSGDANGIFKYLNAKLF